MIRVFFALPLLLLAGCKDHSEPPAGPVSREATSSPREPTSPSPVASSNPPAIPGLRFGQPIPADSPWHADPVQASDECLIYTSKAAPHAYAIVIGNRLERVSYAQGAGFRLPSGIMLGSDEAAVRRAYPDFVREPHKYEAAPAGYLTQPNLAPDQTGLRFEIGPDRKVDVIHIGLPSSLSLVEGCA